MRRLVVGLSSLLGLLVVVAGVPAALLLVGFQPARAGIRSWADLWVRLSMPDDGTLISALITVVAWAAWAYLAVAILVEVVAAVRRIPAPRIPGMQLGQAAARQLVAGVALLFVASPLLGSITQAAAAPITPPPAAGASHATHAPAAPVKDKAAADSHVKKITVHKGDTLSELAEEHLGDAHKWPQIYKASTDIRQPGGHHLTDPDMIDIGWTLEVPQKATQTSHHKDVDQPPVTQAPSTGGGEVTSAPVEVPPATAPVQEVPAQPQAPAPVESAAPAQSQAPATPQVDVAVEADPVPLWAIGAGVGTVVAAGVISLVTYRRRRQLRAWRPGLRIPMPDPAAAATEQQLRAAAAPLSLAIVDRALRALSRDLSKADTALPVIHAARLSPERFELFLTDAVHLPAPWRGTADETVWMLDGVDAEDLPAGEDLSEIPAPYPSLVTIGEDEEHSNVLVDLEHLGSLGIVGDTEATREALAALAIELAVSPWADDLTVTVVGAFAELEGALQTGRVRYLPTVELAIADLEGRSAADHQVLADAGADDVTDARLCRVAPSTWSPEIVIVAGDLTARHRNLLTGLVEELPRVAIAAVTGAGIEPLGEWALHLHADRTAALQPVGLRITPQLIPAAAYTEMLNLVAAATYEDLIPASEEPQDAAEATLEAPSSVVNGQSLPTPPEPRVVVALPTRPAVDLPPVVEEAAEDDAPPAPVTTLPGPVPTIRLLGPVEIDDAEGPVEPSKRSRLLEYATYLHLHPAAPAGEIDAAIWPDRARDDNTTTRNTATSKLRRWLGQDTAGELYLPLNRYELRGVASDWSTWQQLLHRGAKHASTAELDAALKLVRGRPFAGVHPRRYAWAEPARQQMTAEIVEASYELGRRRLMANDCRGVEAAVVVALAIEPALEHLWRLRILAAHHSGDHAAFEEAKARLLAVTDELGLDLEPETNELLADLATDPHRAWEKAIAQ
jgi:DNA-binding SARP family transcriptional activator